MQKFKSKFGLTLPLLIDENNALRKAWKIKGDVFGILPVMSFRFKLFIHEWQFCACDDDNVDAPCACPSALQARITYVIDKDGMVKLAYRSQMAPASHVDKALEALKAL